MAEIDKCSQGTGPAAEESAQDQGEGQGDEGWKHEGDKGSCSKGGTEREQGVKPEQDVDCIGDFILTAVVGFDKEKQEKEQAQKLADEASIREFLEGLPHVRLPKSF